MPDSRLSEDCPIVSVVIPLFNRGDIVLETLHSIAAQSCRAVEAIVVDDGSDDDGPERVRRFAESDERFRLILREGEERGAPVCRNLGFQHSTGAWVVFLDSDDVLASDCIENRLAALAQHPDTEVLLSQALMFHEQPGDSRQLWNRCDFETTDLIERFLNQDMPWPNGGATWSRDALTKLGQWETQLACWQDWELHLRACIQKLTMHVLPQPDFFVRRSPAVAQISQSHNRPKHISSRFLAMDLVIDQLAERNLLQSDIRRSARGLLLRNYLALHDAKCDEQATELLQLKSAKRLLNAVDRWLLAWICRQGESWHWNSRVQRVAGFWWHGILYDALNMKIDYMNAEWSGTIPSACVGTEASGATTDG